MASKDQMRYRKTYSYYRVQPRTQELEIIADESLDWKHSVRAASTGNVTLTGSTPLAVDSVTLVADDRVLLKNQGTASQNGIYYVEISGGSYTLTRDTDAKQGTLTCGAATYVEEGSTNAGRIYIMSTTGTITVGTTSLTWTQFTGAGGGTPGGADTQVQFNDGGSFGGVSGLTFNKTTGALTGTYVLASTGFSGSLTRLTDGTSYLIAGNNVTISTGSNGSVLISSTGGGGGGGDSFWTSSTNDAIYTTGSVAVRGTLGSVDAASDIGSDVFFFVSGSITGSGAEDKKSVFGGDVVMSGSLSVGGDQVEITGSLRVTNGISGSLTTLTNGTPYIIAGTGISVSTGSSGALTISNSGMTGTGTTDFLPIWTSSNALGNGPIRIWTTNVTRYYGNDHQFSPPLPSTDVNVVIKSDTGRVGIGSAGPLYPLDVHVTSAGTATASSFRNTLTGNQGIQMLLGAGQFGEGTFKLLHEWSTDRFFTRFRVTNLSSLNLPFASTGPIEDILVFSSDRSVLVTGSLKLQYDASSQVGTVLDVRRSTGDQLMWMSSSAGTNPVGTDVFMWVSGSRSDDNTGANKVVFGGDVRVSGSLTIGTGSVFITSNDIQFGSTSMRVEKNGNDMKFFDISNPSGYTLSELASGGGGGSSPEYWLSPSSGVIYATGSVGIGTSSISSRLHVSGSGTGATTTLTVRHGVANGSSLPVLNVQNSAGDSLLYVSGSGFVGIGTTTQSALADLVIGTGATIVSVASSGVGSFPGAGILFEVNNTLSGAILVSDAGMTVGGGAGRELFLISDDDTKVAVTPGGLVRIIDNDSYFDADVNSGQGIKLASSPGNAGAQVLDAYYEADLSAVIDCSGNEGNGVYVLDVAYDTLKMTRVGRLVTIGGDLRIDSLGDTPSGRLYILLGTTSGQYPSMDTAASVYVTGAIDLSSAIATSVQAYVEASTSKMYIDGYLDGSKVDIATQVGAGVTIKISVTYAV